MKDLYICLLSDHKWILFSANLVCTAFRFLSDNLSSYLWGIFFISSVNKQLDVGMFLAVKRNGQWIKLTYAEYYNSVIDVAKGFIKVSIMKGNYNVWCC